MKKQIRIINLLIIMVLSVSTLIAGESQIKKESFKVSGECEMCKKRIEASVKVDGVQAAQWNPDTKVMKVKYDAGKISIEKIHQLIAAAGYDTDKEKANPSAYSSLPQCCQYRGKEASLVDLSRKQSRCASASESYYIPSNDQWVVLAPGQSDSAAD